MFDLLLEKYVLITLHFNRANCAVECPPLVVILMMSSKNTETRIVIKGYDSNYLKPKHDKSYFCFSWF